MINFKMLLEFYGRECHHCLKMAPLVERLKKEADLEVTQYEVWHNDENAKLIEKYDKGLCGGVPFFYNTETKNYICGSTSYENLKSWAGAK